MGAFVRIALQSEPNLKGVEVERMKETRLKVGQGKCEHIGVIEKSWVTFRNGGRHVQLVCSGCKKHLGFQSKRELKKEEVIPESKTRREERIELGMPVGCRACGEEVRVRISGFCKDCEKGVDAEKIKRFCNKHSLKIFSLSKEQIFKALL